MAKEACQMSSGDFDSPARSIEAMSQHMNMIRAFEEHLEENGLQKPLGEVLDDLDMCIRLDRNHPDDGTESNIEDIDLDQAPCRGMLDERFGEPDELGGHRHPPRKEDIERVIELQRPQWFRNESDFIRLAEGCEHMKDVHETYYAGWREEDFRQVLGALQECSKEG